MKHVIVRVRVMGSDVDLLGEKGDVCCGYLKPSVWGTYRWVISLPGGNGFTYFHQLASPNWRQVLSTRLAAIWGHESILIVGDDLSPGPAPRAPGLLSELGQ